MGHDMLTQWIENCALIRIGLRGGLVLNFDDDSELVITGPLRLTLPAVSEHAREAVRIDPLAVPDYERPLFDFSGATCTRARVGDDGTLHLEFSGGNGIDVGADEHHAAWELYGKRHGFMVCMPGGRVRVVRHDIEEPPVEVPGPR